MQDRILILFEFTFAAHAKTFVLLQITESLYSIEDFLRLFKSSKDLHSNNPPSAFTVIYVNMLGYSFTSE